MEPQEPVGPQENSQVHVLRVMEADKKHRAEIVLKEITAEKLPRSGETQTCGFKSLIKIQIGHTQKNPQQATL